MASGSDLLLQVPCLSGIDIAELERIPLRRIEFAAGEWVFTPHAPSPDVFIVAEGTIEIFDAAKPDELRRVSRAVAGDILGEHRQGRRPPVWAARAASAAVLLRWTAAELATFFEEYPQVRDGMSFLSASRRMAGKMGFAWLGQDETIYGLARKHPALLARALLLPLLALSAGLGMLAGGGLNGSWLTAGGGALAAFGIAFGIWRASTGATTTTSPPTGVVWLEKVIGLYDNRQESPLRMILSVAVNSGLVGRQLGYGDVEVRTYTGAITLSDTPHPEAFAATIEVLGRRLHRSNLEADRQTIHSALEDRLASGPPAAPLPSYRPVVKDEARQQAVPGLDHWSFEARFEQGGVITISFWRCHRPDPADAASLGTGGRRRRRRRCLLRSLLSAVGAAAWRCCGGCTSSSTGPTIYTRSHRRTSSPFTRSRSVTKAASWHRSRTSSGRRSTGGGLSA
jgi:hypothetical protein